MTDCIDLHADFEPSVHRLTVHFVVTNPTAHELYVIDRAFEVTPRGVVVRPDHLVTTLPGAGLVVVATRLMPPAASATWATPPTIYATLVRAGERYEGRVSALLPLMERPAQAGSVGTARCQRVRFELGVIHGGPTVAAVMHTIDGLSVAELPFRAGHAQVVLSVERAGLDLPCGAANGG